MSIAINSTYDGHKEVVECLVEKGIDISIRYTGENIKNMDAYEYAREFGQTEIAEYLKQKIDKKNRLLKSTYSMTVVLS